MKLLVCSRIDKASLNIADKLIRLHGFRESGRFYRGKPVYETRFKGENVLLVSILGELIDAQYLDKDFKPSLIVFLSRHASLSGAATLSVHTPGNLGAEAHGGLPFKLSICPANAMKAALRKMKELVDARGLRFRVSYEATHHGPSLDVPSLFVEIGSTEREWTSPEAGEVVAEATVAALLSEPDHPAALAVGGPHYSPKFTSIGLWEDYAPAHIVSKYQLSALEKPRVLRSCIERTFESVQNALVDWKGVPGRLRSRLVRRLSDMGLDVIKV